MPTSTPDPFENLDGSVNTRPSDGRGRWVYWGRSFRAAISDSKDSSTPNPPFKSVIGPSSNKTWQLDDNRLKLIDSDGFTDSGQVSFKLSDGWQMLVYMRTENTDYFDDNTPDAIRGEWVDVETHAEEIGERSWPSIWVQETTGISFEDSRTVFVMNGDTDDYVSVDIDAENAQVGQMRVRLDGEQFVSNTQVDDEVWITMEWLRYWDASYVWDDPDQDRPPVECGSGFVYDPDSGSCVRSETDPDPDPDADSNGTGGSGDGSQDQDFPEVNQFLIWGAVALVIWGSIMIARRG